MEASFTMPVAEALSKKKERLAVKPSALEYAWAGISAPNGLKQEESSLGS